jgi:hypothetical protein
VGNVQRRDRSGYGGVGCPLIVIASAELTQ